MAIYPHLIATWPPLILCWLVLPTTAIRANPGQPAEGQLPARHSFRGQGMPMVTSARLIVMPPTLTLSPVVSPDLQCLATAVLAQPWDLLYCQLSVQAVCREV